MDFDDIMGFIAKLIPGLSVLVIYHIIRGSILLWSARSDAQRANYRVRYSTIRWCASDDDKWGYQSKSWNVQVIKPMSVMHDLTPRGVNDTHVPHSVFGGPGFCKMDEQALITTMNLGTNLIPPKGLLKLWAKKTFSANWIYFFNGSIYDLDGNGDQSVTSFFRYGVKKVHFFIEVSPKRKIRKDSIALKRQKFIFRGPADKPGVMTDKGEPVTETSFNIPKCTIFDGPLVVDQKDGRQCIIVGYNVPRLKSEKDKLTNELVVWGVKDTISWEWAGSVPAGKGTKK